MERVFLEDVARRRLGRFSAFADNGRLTALCHVGANVVPSGADCGRFAQAAARGRARMIIGDERAVDELWDDLAGSCRRRARPAGAAGLRDHRAAGSRRLGLAPRPTRTSRCSLPACAAAHEEEIGSIRWRAIRRASAGAPARRSRRAARGSGSRRTILFKARRRRGRRRRSRSSRSGSIRRRAARVTRSAACATLPAPARARADRLPLRPPRERPAIRVYEAIGMKRHGSYRSLIF